MLASLFQLCVCVWVMMSLRWRGACPGACAAAEGPSVGRGLRETQTGPPAVPVRVADVDRTAPRSVIKKKIYLLIVSRCVLYGRL